MRVKIYTLTYLKMMTNKFESIKDSILFKEFETKHAIKLYLAEISDIVNTNNIVLLDIAASSFDKMTLSLSYSTEVGIRRITDLILNACMFLTTFPLVKVHPYLKFTSKRFNDDWLVEIVIYFKAIEKND